MFGKAAQLKKVILAALAALMILPQMANAGSVTGTVTRDSNGSPISGLWVNAGDYDTGGGSGGDQTDVNGVYEITGLPTGTYRVEVGTWDTDYVRQYYNNKIRWEQATPVSVSAGQQTANIDFSLIVGASMSGFVKNSKGNPVDDVEIDCSVEDVYYACRDTTEPNGHYKIRGLLPGHQYRVIAYPPGTTDYMITLIDVPVPEVNDYTAPDIVLQRGALSVSGTVTDKATGAPLEDICVFCWLDDIDVWTDTYTDANGIYALTNLPAGAGEVEIRAEPTSYYACIGTEFELTEDIDDLDFALPIEAVLSGKVIDATTAEPVGGVEVTYGSNRYAVWKNDYTDADGGFTLTNLPPGIADIKARPNLDTGYAWSLPWGSSWLYLEEGQHESKRIIALQKGALVTGFIKDPNGDPLSNIEYDWLGKMCEGWFHTDIDGHYEIRLPLGTYAIGLDEDDFGAIPLIITIADIDTPVEVNDIIAYSEETGGQISGDVNNTGGYPKTGLFLIVTFETGTTIDPNTWYTIEPVGETGLGGPGPFAINTLPPDVNYDVYLLVASETPDEIESIALQDYLLDVAPGANDVNLYYSSEGGTVTGSVVNVDSLPVLGATVLLTDQSTGTFAGFGDTDPNGEYVIYNVPAGTYTATTVHSKYLNSSTEVQVIDGASTDAGTIVMPFAGQKEGPNLNGDGFVNMLDFAEFGNQWNQSGLLEADFNQDDIVDVSDLIRLTENWLWQPIWYHD